jgi:hypothetical protein
MGFGGSMMFNEPPLEYYRAVSIVMRDIKTQQIVYETSAQRQDVWTDDPAIFGILFDAALTGFPKPPQGRAMCAPSSSRQRRSLPAARLQPRARRTGHASHPGQRGAGHRGAGTLICNLQQLPGLRVLTCSSL